MRYRSRKNKQSAAINVKYNNLKQLMKKYTYSDVQEED
jgi:hypothetical protein